MDSDTCTICNTPKRLDWADDGTPGLVFDCEHSEELERDVAYAAELASYDDGSPEFAGCGDCPFAEAGSESMIGPTAICNHPALDYYLTRRFATRYQPHGRHPGCPPRAKRGQEAA